MNSKTISLIGRGWLSQLFESYLNQQGFNQIDVYSRSQKPQFELGGQAPLPSAILNSHAIYIMVPPRSPGYLEGLKTLSEKLPPTTLVILVSSTGVYGQSTGNLDEEIVPELKNERNHKLWLAEETIRNLQRSTIIRSAGQIGPERYPALSLIEKEILINGNARANIIHSIDLCRILELPLITNFEGKTINAVSPYHPYKKDFYRDQAQSLGLKPPIFREGDYEEKIISSIHLKDFSFKRERCQV